LQQTGPNKPGFYGTILNQYAKMADFFKSRMEIAMQESIDNIRKNSKAYKAIEQNAAKINRINELSLAIDKAQIQLDELKNIN
jgi:hypothetical protein